MNRWIFCIALIAALPAQAENPWTDTRHARQRVTVAYLYETCHVVGQTAHGMIPHFDCESYVYGVLDSHLAVRDNLPKAARACFARKLPPWQALADAEPHVNKNVWEQDAATFLVDVLRRKYPCK